MHAESAGRRQRVIEPAHFAGVAGFGRAAVAPQPAANEPAAEPALLRPLAEYERLVGGGWR